MKTIKVILIFFFISNLTCFAKISETDIVDLSKIYNKFHAFSELTDDARTKLEQFKGTELETVAIFIKELCTNNNDILNRKYLTCPDSASLRYFHIIILVNYNMFRPGELDNKELAKKLLQENLDFYESMRFYYSSIFTSITNKDKDFDFSKVDIKLDSINLLDDTQKGIFFLEFTQSMGFQAISYIRYAQTPNYEASYNYLQRLPKINSLPYFNYTFFGFQDIKMLINRKNQSFKKYYLQQYYDLLLIHYYCLDKLNKDETEKNDLLLSSILNPSYKIYYTYSKDKKIIEDLYIRVDK